VGSCENCNEPSGCRNSGEFVELRLVDFEATKFGVILSG
jgi:hypothetical protein